MAYTYERNGYIMYNSTPVHPLSPWPSQSHENAVKALKLYDGKMWENYMFLQRNWGVWGSIIGPEKYEKVSLIFFSAKIHSNESIQKNPPI